jgi:hypothetical protein
MPVQTAEIVHIGIRGTAIALDRASGAEIWRTPLKGAGFVNLVLDGGCLIATTKGEVFCLDPLSGQILWNNPMRGMGLGLATVATPAASSQAIMAELIQQQERAAAAAAAT